MIIVVNGAQKSGSTWLMQIALEIRPCDPLPDEARDAAASSGNHFLVDRHHLPQLLRDQQFLCTDRLIKSHFNGVKQRDLLLQSPDVRVVDIARDIRDVAVSYYYHRQKLGKFSGTFEAFYWSQRNVLLWPVLMHRAVWDIQSPRFLLLHYDELRNDFAAQVQRLGTFLEVPLNDDQIAAIAAATSPQSISQRFEWGAMNRFRKGISGEWQSHFDEHMLADIDRIQRYSRSLRFRLAVRGPQPLRRLLRRWRRPPAIR